MDQESSPIYPFRNHNAGLDMNIDIRQQKVQVSLRIYLHFCEQIPNAFCGIARGTFGSRRSRVKGLLHHHDRQQVPCECSCGTLG